MAPLSGQRAVVVGATSLHAAGLMQALRGAGAEVLVVDRDAAALAAGFRAGVTVCDMSESGIEDAVGAIEASGNIDMLVTTPARLLEMPMGTDGDTVAAALHATLQPAFLWTAVVSRRMKARGRGVIVHVTGLSGLGGWPGWESAGAVFAGIHNLVSSFAVEVAASGVRINALVPGVTDQQGAQIAAALGRPLGDVADRVPLRRFLPDAALGHALLYLVHPSSSYVSGEILAVDGGWTMWGRLHAMAS